MASKNPGNGIEPSTSPKVIKTFPKVPRMLLFDCIPGDRELPLLRVPLFAFLFPFLQPAAPPPIRSCLVVPHTRLMPVLSFFLSCLGVVAGGDGAVFSQERKRLRPENRGKPALGETSPRRSRVPGFWPSFPPSPPTPLGLDILGAAWCPASWGLYRGEALALFLGGRPSSTPLSPVSGLPGQDPGPACRPVERAPSPPAFAFPGGSLSPQLRAEGKGTRAR